MSYPDTRQRIADALAMGTGLRCDPYEPDNPTPPCGFVDSLEGDHTQPASWGLPVDGVARALTVGLRRDRAGTMRDLEHKIPATVAELQAAGMRVVAVQSGDVEVGKQTLPGVVYTIRTPMA